MTSFFLLLLLLLVVVFVVLDGDHRHADRPLPFRWRHHCHGQQQQKQRRRRRRRRERWKESETGSRETKASEAKIILSFVSFDLFSARCTFTNRTRAGCSALGRLGRAERLWAVQLDVAQADVDQRSAADLSANYRRFLQKLIKSDYPMMIGFLISTPMQLTLCTVLKDDLLNLIYWFIFRDKHPMQRNLRSADLFHHLSTVESSGVGCWPCPLSGLTRIQ